MWIAFNKSIPNILMPAMVANPAQRDDAAAGRVFIELSAVRTYLLGFKPESGTGKNFFFTFSTLDSRVCLLFFRAEGAANARTNETVRQGVAAVKKSTQDIVTILGENIPKPFSARFARTPAAPLRH